MSCYCFYCRMYMEHPTFQNWLIPGLRAIVKCDGCGREFQVWFNEL